MPLETKAKAKAKAFPYLARDLFMAGGRLVVDIKGYVRKYLL